MQRALGPVTEVADRGGVVDVAHADRHSHTVDRFDRQGADRPANPLGGGERLEAVGVGQDPGELVAADSRHQLALAGEHGEPPGQLDEYGIADRATVIDVDLIAVIDPDDRHAERPAVAAGAGELAGQTALEGTMVGQPSQRIVEAAWLGGHEVGHSPT
jgi:hypothetical protein